MKKISLKQIVTILATIALVVLNILANALPFNGLNTGEISDRFDILFVPAGYVFSIWLLIYIGLIAYTVFQALPSQRDNPLLNKLAWPYWISVDANIIWLVLWHWEVFSLTLVAMAALLVSLLVIYLRIRNIGRDLTAQERWLVRLPFSVYLGWVSVATVANATQVLYFYGWNGFGIAPEVWAAIMIAVATILGLLMLARERDLGYAAVLVWAFIGIANKQAGVPMVMAASWAGAVMLAVAGLAVFIKDRKKREV